MSKIYYWKGLISICDDAAFAHYHEKIQTIIEEILSGETHAVDFDTKTINGHPFYTARVNKTHCLLFTNFVATNGYNYLLLLEFIPEHRYDQARFLRRSDMLGHFFHRHRHSINQEIAKTDIILFRYIVEQGVIISAEALCKVHAVHHGFNYSALAILLTTANENCFGLVSTIISFHSYYFTATPTADLLRCFISSDDKEHGTNTVLMTMVSKPTGRTALYDILMRANTNFHLAMWQHMQHCHNDTSVYTYLTEQAKSDTTCAAIIKLLKEAPQKQHVVSQTPQTFFALPASLGNPVPAQSDELRQEIRRSSVSMTQ